MDDEEQIDRQTFSLRCTIGIGNSNERLLLAGQGFRRVRFSEGAHLAR
jgi:hypothetical protein